MSEPTPVAATLSPRQRTAIMIAVLLGTLLSALDQTITATAGPQIIADLKVSPGLYDWITAAYALASTVLMPVWGKLSDLHGRRPVLVVGMSLFCAASLGCGLAPSFGWLVGFRAMQGMGAAALLTTSLAVTADLYPPAIRAKVNGLFAAMWGIAGVAGPLLGGLITDHASWHWTFFLNLPVGAVALAFIALAMPRLGGGRHTRLDLTGATTLVVATVPLLLALTLGRGELTLEAEQAASLHQHWADPKVLALLALACAGAGAFLLSQVRSPSPIMDLRLFSEPVFRWGVVASLCFGMVLFISVVFAPLFLQRVLGKSSTSAGVVLSAMTLGMVTGNISSGILASRLGTTRGILLAGALACTCAFTWVAATLDERTSTTLLALQLLAIGLALGPLLPLYLLVIQNGAAQRDLGSTTATVSFFRQIGSTAGIALSGTVFALRLGAQQQSAHAMTGAVAATFWFGAALCAVGLIATLLMPHTELRKV